MKNFKLFLQSLSVIVFVFLQQSPYRADDVETSRFYRPVGLEFEKR
ncbi:MAG: hypothetical protein KA146_08215 [Leptospiraceae bacterium]|nr:hypothetical protein [Leptospiraceae bacterium]